MTTLVLILALIGAADDAQKDREWLLAQLAVEGQLDAAKIIDTEQKLARMTPSQVRILVNVYKIRKEQVSQQQANSVSDTDLAEFNRARQQDRLRAYSEHLAREAQYQNLVRSQQLELLRRANAYQGMAMGYASGLYWDRVNGGWHPYGRYPSFGFGGSLYRGPGLYWDRVNGGWHPSFGGSAFPYPNVRIYPLPHHIHRYHR